MNDTNFVNVFHGVGKSVAPSGDGLYSKWNLLKGKAGNTSPSACLPFGAVACSPYSGGYSSGYGNYKPSGGMQPQKFFEGDKIIGFTHFTHSGSGAFGFYYNYLLVAPYTKAVEKSLELKEIEEEYGETGYYSCKLKEEKIRCEVTVSKKVALHRYASETGENLNLTIDISNDGLLQNNPRLKGYSSESEIRLYGDSFGGYITMQGVKIYFYGVVSAEKVRQTLWKDGETLIGSQLSLGKTESRFGCRLETNQSEVEVKIGFSLESETYAMASVRTVECFDTVKNQAEREWAQRLSSVEIEGVTDEDRGIFYSNYYHSLVKPCSWQKESFLWDEKETFYLDFATLWDVYKTQLPLIFTLYKDVGRGIVKTFLKYGKKYGKLFNALMLTANMNVESTQACCLGCYVLYDAYVYGLVEESEIDDLFTVAKSEIGQYRQFVLNGEMEKTTKLLDCTLIADAYARLAKKLNRAEDESYFTEIAERWTDAFGEDGLLKENYPYYEGNRWNYSFRFVPDIEKRIAIGGGKEKILKALDGFFAFTDDNPLENRFEGFNNETDMETPYFYHYVGGYDKLVKILKECKEVCFRSGRESLPGNNDSGGLSACYLWNFLGLFPISGQDEVFVGYPSAESATLRLSSGKELKIRSVGRGERIEKILYDGEKIEGYTIPISKLMQGGEIIFYKN